MQYVPGLHSATDVFITVGAGDRILYVVAPY